MTKVIRYTKFQSNPHGDGGSKRSVQIEEFWKNQTVQFIEEKFELPKKYSKWQAFKWCVRAIVFIHKQVGWNQFSTLKDRILAILTYALRIPIIYDKYKGQDVIFLWENTNDVPALYLMKAAGAKVIAYPHNLESLVPTQKDYVSRKMSPYWLYEEIERLKLCDEVYTISKEETWLLQLFGINAMYFPYYPPKEAESNFLFIREERKKRQKSDINNYLILGSATNPPTRDGMQKLIDFFAECDKLPYNIYVAGYKSETLTYRHSPYIQYYGTVSSDKLLELLIEIDGIIINQPTTSGALTRIVENRIAGIPVYANFGAARDFYNLSDVHVYDSLDDLNNILVS